VSPILDRSYVIEADGRTLTVGELRRVMDHLPDDAIVMFDGGYVRAVTPYGGVLHVDSGRQLPAPCPGCGRQGCDGECR
jgi:hypothetical protein